MTIALWAIALAVVFHAWKGMKMSAALERLTASVENLTTVNDSAIQLIANIAAEIRDNAADEAAMIGLADRLDTESAELAEAVSANTPASEPAPEEPAPEEPAPEEPAPEEPAPEEPSA